MLRISHCQHNRLTDGCEVVSLTRRPRSVLQNFPFVPGTHFCWILSKPQDLERSEELGALKTFIDLIGTRARDIRAFSIMPQTTMLRHVSIIIIIIIIIIMTSNLKMPTIEFPPIV
jgi:hypothetical protein